MFDPFILGVTLLSNTHMTVGKMPKLIAKAGNVLKLL